MRVLEIGCGTGEDAVWLAKQGAHVIATDASPAMLDVTREKARRAGVLERIETSSVDAADPFHRRGAEDAEESSKNTPRSPRLGGETNGQSRLGVRSEMGFSNFGALNCVPDLRPIANALGEWIEPGGTLVLVFINRWCAWEMLWHIAHWQPRVAFRRLSRDGVEARVGEGSIHTWYPAIRSIQSAFAPAFHLKHVTGLGVFLPPSYLEPAVAKRPRFFKWLARLEQLTARIFPFNRIADHVILEFEKT
jgi:SAM-dependent methyltransferase